MKEWPADAGGKADGTGDMAAEAGKMVSDAGELAAAKKKCLRLLEAADRSKAQLRQKLLDAGFGEAAADAAFGFAASHGYVDDGRFADNYVRLHCQKQSRRVMAAALKERGVEEETIDEALSAYADEELEAAKRLLARKIESMEEDPAQGHKTWERAVRSLMGKGFSYSLIRKAREELEFPQNY